MGGQMGIYHAGFLCQNANRLQSSRYWIFRLKISMPTHFVVASDAPV